MNKLYTSEKDLFLKTISDHISKAKDELTIFSPYITTKVLEKLLSNCKLNKITIITTWNLRDMQFGSSDPELYTFCKKNNIHLFLNQRIHLKALINDNSNCILSSANISHSGLALNNNYNYELATKMEDLNCNELLYFKTILKESILVTDQIYNKYKEELKKLKQIKPIKEIDINKIKPNSEFLISSLPMSKDINRLYNIYSNHSKNIVKEELQCATHDIILYEIPPNLTKEDFIKHLKQSFFQSKFIIKLLDFIDDEKYFGRVKEWIQKNCDDVPIPSRRDLTSNIQVLYKWIIFLSNGLYKIDIPKSHSERIYKVE